MEVRKDGDPVYVTKSFLPPREEFDAYVDKIWNAGQLTNRGPLLTEFEGKVADYLGVDNFQFVTNGTLALQLAIDSLGIKSGEIITTPFSYVATASAILWQRCRPVFVDIEKDTLNIDTSKIEASITSETKAILAVHVFGNACDVEAIQDIADKFSLKVIYDAAHAFGVKYKGKSLLDYGDVSIVSFHATKLFHTIEGGGIVSKDKKVHDTIDLRKRFGHNSDEHIELGINAKASDFQAAMGLVNLNYINKIIESRGVAFDFYSQIKNVERPAIRKGVEYNNAYYPIIFSSEKSLLEAQTRLNQNNIFPRRYFFPSLNTISYIAGDKPQSCPISEDISRRVLCIPLYYGIDRDTLERVVGLLNE